VQINLHLYVSLDVPEASELIEVSAEGVSGVVEGLVASADETASFDDVVPLIESRSGEILVNGMDLEVLEGINRGDGVLPYVSNNIVELSSFEEINRTRRHPVLHVDVTH
jgi:hypothetical protein